MNAISEPRWVKAVLLLLALGFLLLNLGLPLAVVFVEALRRALPIMPPASASPMPWRRCA